MSKLKDLTGRSFGKWRVLGRSSKKSYRILWDCVCECGATQTVFGNNLSDKKSTRCKNCPRLIEQEVPFRALVRVYRENAKRTGKVFTLSIKRIRKLTSSNCTYCGVAPAQESKHRTHDGKIRKNSPPYVYNGIDRVNNSLGYTIKNCVSCCKICNYMKQGLSQKEFFQHIRRILERRPQ